MGQKTQEVRRLHIEGDFLFRAICRLLMTVDSNAQQTPRLLGRNEPPEQALLQNQLGKGQSCKACRIGGKILHILKPEKATCQFIEFIFCT